MHSNPLISALLDESKWLTVSMGIALVSSIVLLSRLHTSEVSQRQRILGAMNLFFGLTIATMTFGHLLAVTVKLVLGTLEGSVLTFYAIGLALAFPSYFVLAQTGAILRPEDPAERRTLYVNAWLGITLLALGLPNIPLAAPALLTIAYRMHTDARVGWTIVAVFIVMNVGLFIGSLIFFASGQSFEQFRGME